jgi:sortase A
MSRSIKIISLGFIFLGLLCVIWALFHISKQSKISNPVSESTSFNVSATEKPIAFENENSKPKESIVEESKPDTSEAEENEILYPIRPKKGEHIGTLIIPALEKEMPIYHGTDEDELKKGVGHFAQSVLPGENNNSVLSGHRDTIFRNFGELKAGDHFIVQTSAGKFTYEIRDTQIVEQDDKTIIVPTDHAVLTVTTCYPFDYIGSAPDRYILSADLIERE